MKTKKWKTYKHLKSEEAISAYLSESFAGGTSAEITSALNDAHLASEMVLAKDWISPEEDEAWKDL
jgi:DNA-binding phage protein